MIETIDRPEIADTINDYASKVEER